MFVFQCSQTKNIHCLKSLKRYMQIYNAVFYDVNFSEFQSFKNSRISDIALNIIHCS